MEKEHPIEYDRMRADAKQERDAHPEA